MQNVTDFVEIEAQETAAETSGLTISLEFVAYAIIVVLALLLRFAELDTVPLSNDESRAALAAWRAVTPGAAGEPITPSSPLLFLLHVMSFSTLGANELTARALTALGGTALVLLPLLFRPLLGAGRAFIFSLLLLFSPVALVASRESSPVIWSMLLAGVGLWALWRYQTTRQTGMAALALTMVGGLLFLSEPGGPILALLLAGALFIAVSLKPTTDEEVEALLQEPSEASGLRMFPWSAALPAALIIVAVATGFMLNPAGLSAVGELLGGTVSGFSTPYPNRVIMFPAVIALFYEPFIWGLALAGLVLLAQRDALSLADRTFVGWTLLALTVSLLFVGAAPAHALWLTIPLTGLASYAVMQMFGYDERDALWQIPRWARGLTALAMVAILAVFTLAFHSVARTILNSPTLEGINLDAPSAILMLVSALFVVVGYFLVSSIWDGRTALRGIGLGVTIFGAITSLGSGWGAAVTHAADPLEFWHTSTISRDVFLLRETLFEVAKREARGFPDLAIQVQAEDDGAVAWTLRDFDEVTFIDSVGEAGGRPVVLLPDRGLPEALGAAYLGQDFTVRSTWFPESLTLTSLPAWWSQRLVNGAQLETERYALWLRQDIYEGVPLAREPLTDD